MAGGRIAGTLVMTQVVTPALQFMPEVLLPDSCYFGFLGPCESLSDPGLS